MPDTATVLAPSSAKTTEHFDVLVVGAGISGVGGAYHLTKQSPGTSFVVLESQESFGGTWITHRYPGIRSDSDLYTFGYRFKPWTGKPIATAEEILDYMGEVIEGERPSRRPSAIAIASPRRLGRAPTISLTIEGERSRTPASPSASRRVSCGCARLLPATPKLYARVEGMATSRAASSIPRLGPRTSTSRTSGDRDRLGATARPGCPTSPTTVRTSPCCSARRPIHPGAQANDLADQLRQLEVDDAWIHEIVRRRILRDQSVFTPAAVRRARQGARRTSGRRARLSRPRRRHRRPLHALLPAVAPAHRLRARRRPVPRHAQEQGLRRHR